MPGRRTSRHWGAPNITRPEDMPPTAHFEIKFRAPDNVVFDISHSTWPGAAPVDPATTKQAVTEPADKAALNPHAPRCSTKLRINSIALSEGAELGSLVTNVWGW